MSTNKKNAKKSTKRVIRALNEKEMGFVSAILADKPYLSDADIAHNLHNNGYANDLSQKDLRNKIRYARLKITEEAPAVRTRIQTHKDGSVTINHHDTGMKMDHAEKYLDEKLLSEMNLDPSKYALSSYGESEWETAKGDTLHSTRKKFVRLNSKDIDTNNLALATTRRKLMQIFNNNVDRINTGIEKFESPAELLTNAYGAFYSTTKIVKDTTGKYSILLPLTDLHIGEGAADKMAKSYKATFENTILPQIKERYFGSGSSSVRTIDIPCLGDIIHCDNAAGTTTAGTALQPKSDAYTSFDVAVDFIEWLIATLRDTFKVPVRIIYVYGNHDNNMGFGIMRVLAAMFRNVEGVEFLINEKLISTNNFEEDEDDWYNEAERNPEYMWVSYDRVGITYAHGKFMKKNMKEIPDVANINARRDADYNAVIYGHLHHLAEGTANANQHNFGISTPNFVRDKFARSLGCVTDPEFYLFEVNHHTNRVNYTPFPSLPYNKQRC